MGSPNFLMPMLVVSSLIVASLILLPFMVVRLTQPRWALFKSAIEFVIMACLLSALFTGAVGVPVALALAVLSHRRRASRYAASSPGPEES